MESTTIFVLRTPRGGQELLIRSPDKSSRASKEEKKESYSRIIPTKNGDLAFRLLVRSQDQNPIVFLPLPFSLSLSRTHTLSLLRNISQIFFGLWLSCAIWNKGKKLALTFLPGRRVAKTSFLIFHQMSRREKKRGSDVSKEIKDIVPDMTAAAKKYAIPIFWKGHCVKDVCMARRKDEYISGQEKRAREWIGSGISNVFAPLIRSDHRRAKFPIPHPTSTHWINPLSLSLSLSLALWCQLNSREKCDVCNPIQVPHQPPSESGQLDSPLLLGFNGHPPNKKSHWMHNRMGRDERRKKKNVSQKSFFFSLYYFDRSGVLKWRRENKCVLKRVNERVRRHISMEAIVCVRSLSHVWECERK